MGRVLLVVEWIQLIGMAGLVFPDGHNLRTSPVVGFNRMFLGGVETEPEREVAIPGVDLLKVRDGPDIAIDARITHS